MRINSLQEKFSQPLLDWFDRFGRKNLPWQNPRTPYRVWVSEIMLQQTQVKTVLPYFNRFMDKFPDIWHLAKAPEDEILSHWSGLGYYSRARNLIKTAKIICEKYQGIFPQDLQTLMALPGIGASTAAAIASQAFDLATPILDGNVKRVLSRYFMVEGSPELSKVKNYLWQLAQKCMPVQRCADYTQAIMDLGATCCTSKKPACQTCPLQHNCLAFIKSKVEEYPFKKIKKNRPVQEKTFLLLHNVEGAIYLEKRPPTGLWGGLWCMPIIEPQISAEDYIKKTYYFDTLETRQLMSLKHTFSHFQLHITALALCTVPIENKVNESFGKWIPVQELNQLGLATPTMTIIKHFLETKFHFPVDD